MEQDGYWKMSTIDIDKVETINVHQVVCFSRSTNNDIVLRRAVFILLYRLDLSLYSLVDS